MFSKRKVYCLGKGYKKSCIQTTLCLFICGLTSSSCGVLRPRLILPIGQKKCFYSVCAYFKPCLVFSLLHLLLTLVSLKQTKKIQNVPHFFLIQKSKKSKKILNIQKNLKKNNQKNPKIHKNTKKNQKIRKSQKSLHWKSFTTCQKEKRRRRIFFDMWHVTCDTWHLTCDMGHVGGAEHSQKISVS